MDPEQAVSIPQAEAAERAGAAFQSVFENGTKIELDHYIVYFARKRRVQYACMTVTEFVAYGRRL